MNGCCRDGNGRLTSATNDADERRLDTVPDYRTVHQERLEFLGLRRHVDHNQVAAGHRYLFDRQAVRGWKHALVNCLTMAPDPNRILGQGMKTADDLRITDLLCTHPDHD